MLRNRGGVHSHVHRADQAAVLRPVGVRAVLGGREGGGIESEGVASAGDGDGGGAAVAHGGVQELQVPHAQPAAVAGECNAGHCQEELPAAAH